MSNWTKTLGPSANDPMSYEEWLELLATLAGWGRSITRTSK